MNRTHRTLRTTLTRAILGPALMLATGAGSYAAVQAVMPDPVSTVDHAAAQVLPGEARLTAMLAAGECWTGGEGHPVPSRVWLWVERTSGPRYVLRGQRATDRALSDYSHVAAFCR